MPDELTDAIEAAITEPKRMQTDDQEVEAHNLKDMVEAAKFIKGTTAGANPARGLRITKLIPGGSV